MKSRRSSEPPKDTRVSSRLLRQVGFGSAAGTVPILGFVEYFAKADPNTASVQLALGSAAFLVGWFIRFIVHIEIGYFTWLPTCPKIKKGRRPGNRAVDASSYVSMNKLVILDGLLIVCWIGSIVWILLAPSPLLQLLLTGGLAAWAAFVASLTVDAAIACNLRSGTATLHYCKVGRFAHKILRPLRPIALFAIIERKWRVRPVSTEKDVSAFVALVFSFFLIVIGADLVPAAQATTAFATKIGKPTTKTSTGELHTKTKLSSAAPPSPVIPPAASGGTYLEECGSSVQPGDAAPAPVAPLLRALWLGSRLLRIDGAGAARGGCAELAYPEPGRPTVWLEPATCGSTFRALGIATEGQTPALLYQQAGEEALEDASSGILISATPRYDVRSGDLYLIQTTLGTITLVRSDSSGGEILPDPNAIPCAQYSSNNADYVRLPPALSTLWTSEMARAEGWLWPSADNSGSSAETFTFKRPTTGEVVATAVCTSDSTCTMTAKNHTYRSAGVAPIDLDDVLRLAS